ncbi:MAG: dual specificity protein phosphatase family protein [Candidatus Chisholmbacteria bacterium]|nr:dual specificity protein phosphatase family protein [Candidatus Chisholmbacteria bacterium]
MTNHPQIKELEYDYITDGIYIGTNQCCQTHFDEKLRKEEIEVDISLEENRVDSPLGIKFYIWLPVKDDTAPTDDQLGFGVAVLEKFVDMKKKIYVHCMNGHGRSTVLVAAYLIKRGRTVQQALDLIKLKRPSIHLEKIQIQALEKYASTTNNHNCC